MSLIFRAKEELLSHMFATCVAATTVLAGWFLSLVAPILKPAILAALPAQAVLPLLLLSLLLNLIFAVLIYQTTKKQEPELQLRFGVYWDKNKNPHCPVCQKPVRYDDWGYSGVGYYCQPCKQVTTPKDLTGKNMTSTEALSSWQ